MGQKVNPNCFRIGVTSTWQSLWYDKGSNYTIKLHQDIKIRNIISARIEASNISKIIINRLMNKVIVNIHSHKPKSILGKNGIDIIKIKNKISKLLYNSKIVISITEIKRLEDCPNLIALSISSQLKKKISFRKIIKKIISKVIKLGTTGIKISLKGRLGGIEIARREWFKEGKIPLHTIRFKVEYSLVETKTSYGMIGIKVWIYNN